MAGQKGGRISKRTGGATKVTTYTMSYKPKRGLLSRIKEVFNHG